MHRWKSIHRFFFVGLFYLIHTSPQAQSFVKITPQNAVGLYTSRAEWFDFDNDGDLDFVISGQVDTNDLRTLLYENLGNDSFRPAQQAFSLPPYGEIAMCLANLNNDDRIDIMLMGRIIGIIPNKTSMMWNTTTGFQEHNTIPNFVNQGSYQTISTGDLNHDAQADFFIANTPGFTSTPTLKAGVYVNNNGQYLEKAGPAITGLYLASSVLADFDADGDLDLVQAGSVADFPYQRSEIYFNDGVGNFTLNAAQSFEKLQNTAIDVADFDNDHDMDIIMSGYNSQLEPTTKLYRNNLGQFSEVTGTGINGNVGGSIKWGDFDNDGDLDILMSGAGPSFQPNFCVLRNLGNNTFERMVNSGGDVLIYGSSAWGDYDDDGDLDIVTTGITGQSRQLYVFRNESAVKNTKPSVPQNLSVIQNSAYSLTVHWDASSDVQSSQASLTYNLEITRGSPKEYLLYSFSHPNGKRKVAMHGNMGLNTQTSFTNLADGIYHFRIQSVDGGYLGSDFSTDQTGYIGIPTAASSLTACMENSKVRLRWTDTSINEEVFIIERALENDPFSVLTTVPGNTTTYDDPFSQAGLYHYRVRASNPNGQSSYSNVADVNTNPPAIALNLGPDRFLCNQSQSTINAGPGFDSYIWSTGATSPSIAVGSSGLFWVKAAIGCSFLTDSITIKFERDPVLDLGPNLIRCSSNLIVLRAGGNYSSYRWQDNSSDQNYSASGNGVFWVQVMNGCGTASDSVRITEGIPEINSIFIPNVITPNGDIHNQYFEIDNRLSDARVNIYNRWGNEVRSFENYKNNWDADDASAGTYYYYIIAKNKCNDEMTFKGTLQIVK